MRKHNRRGFFQLVGAAIAGRRCARALARFMMQPFDPVRLTCYGVPIELIRRYDPITFTGSPEELEREMARFRRAYIETIMANPGPPHIGYSGHFHDQAFAFITPPAGEERAA